MVGWGRKGEKSRRATDTPALFSPNLKLYFCALVLGPGTNKTQGALSEELSTWPKSLC